MQGMGSWGLGLRNTGIHDCSCVYLCVCPHHNMLFFFFFLNTVWVYACVSVCVSAVRQPVRQENSSYCSFGWWQSICQHVTGSLGETIITVSGYVGSGLCVLCLLVCLCNCLQSGYWALDSRFSAVKSFLFLYRCFRLSLSTGLGEEIGLWGRCRLEFFFLFL